MRAISFDEFGGPEVLKIVEVPKPCLRPGDLLVKVHAAGVNRADLNQRKGAYGRADFGDSTLMGLEMAGEVVAVAGDVTGFAIGDRVMGIVGGGGYAEYARIPSGMAMHVPSALSFVEAAAIPEAFITAHEALLHLGALKPGECALIHGGAGGIGSAAVQLAGRVTDKVFFTSSAARMAQVGTLVSAHGIDYAMQDFVAVLHEATGGNGVDVILDVIGEPNFERNCKALAEGGRLVQVGLMGGNGEARLSMRQLLFRRLRIIGTVMKSQSQEAKVAMTSRFSAMWMDMMADGGMVAVIDRTLPLDQAAQAHAAMESGGLFGKIILAP